MKISIAQIKKLREKTGAPVAEIKRALEEALGDEKKAKDVLKKSGFARAAKKAEREIKAGWIFSYIHHSGQVGALVDLGCETDFVARNEEFQNLGKEIAMQVASMNPRDVKDLLLQGYIRQPDKTVEDLIKEAIAKTGENIRVEEFKRFEV
ncbi:MAG: translation elongation factor Ts [Candidatus Blackburnbacteria bacterium]|nr:translation elongation factor Ts [Candidatus Blackburnbacteria bacterium]